MEENVVEIVEAVSGKEFVDKPVKRSRSGSIPKAKRSLEKPEENVQKGGRKATSKIKAGTSASQGTGNYTCEYCKKSAVDLMIECESCLRWVCLRCQDVPRCAN